MQDIEPGRSEWRGHLWWLWRRFSLRQILRNPLRIVAVIASVALATTLWSAVLKVSIASVSTFEQSLGFGESQSGILVSPVGGRIEERAVQRCFAPLSAYADIAAIRREAGVLRTKTGSRVVSVAGVAGYGTSQGVALSRDSRWEVSPETREALGLIAGESITLSVAGASFNAIVPELSGRLLQGELVDVVVPFEEMASPAYIDSVVLKPRTGNTADFVRDISSFIRSCLAGSPEVRIETFEKPLQRAENLLAAYRMNIVIMAGVTLLVCGLLVSQATHVALRAQLRELSILRSLGVSRGSCFATVVVEGALLSLLGALLGSTVGYPIAVWLTGFLINTAQEIYQVSMQPFGLGYSFTQVLAVLVGISLWGAFSSACAARGVLSLAPYRGTRREQIHNHPLQKRTATVCAVVGLLVCASCIALAEYVGGTIYSYISVASVLFCAVLCSPLAMALVARSIPITAGLLALRLARGSVRAAGRHFLLSGVAASLAIALMTGLSLMVLSFHGTLSRWSATRLSGDLFVSAALSGNGNEGRIEPRYVDAIRGNAAFSAVVPYYETTSEVNQRSVVVGGTDISLQCQRSVYTFLQGGCESKGGLWDNQVLVSESAARKLNLAVGAIFTLEGIDLAVRGILQEFGTEQPLVVIDQRIFQQRYPEHHPKTLTLDLTSSGERNRIRESIVALAPELLIVRDSRELRDLVDTLFNRTFRVTESVRWIVFVLAILGLVSTGVQYVWERRREFKTASIIGVPRFTLALSVGVETGAVALAALVTGLITGSAIGWCLTRYINPYVFGWSLTFTLSTRPFAEAVLFLLAVVLLSTLISWRIFGMIARTVRLADE